MGHYGDMMIEQELLNNGVETTHKIAYCKCCGKEYVQRIESQIAGFREKDYDVCPYCNNTNGESMQVEFYNSRFND